MILKQTGLTSMHILTRLSQIATLTDMIKVTARLSILLITLPPRMICTPTMKTSVNISTKFRFAFHFFLAKSGIIQVANDSPVIISTKISWMIFVAEIADIKIIAVALVFAAD